MCRYVRKMAELKNIKGKTMFMTVKNLALHMKCSKAKIYIAIKEGDIATESIGNVLMVSVKDFKTYCKNRTKGRKPIEGENISEYCKFLRRELQKRKIKLNYFLSLCNIKKMRYYAIRGGGNATTEEVLRLKKWAHSFFIKEV